MKEKSYIFHVQDANETVGMDGTIEEGLCQEKKEWNMMQWHFKCR